MERIATRSSRDFPLLLAAPLALNPPGLRIILPLPIGRGSPTNVRNETVSCVSLGHALLAIDALEEKSL